jgi:hypothetical protein
MISPLKQTLQFGRNSGKASGSKLITKAGRSKKGMLARITLVGDRLAFSWPVREALFRHMSAQVGNGVAVEVALDTFRARLQRRKKVSSDKIVADIARRMRDGSTLASALAIWITNRIASWAY